MLLCQHGWIACKWEKVTSRRVDFKFQCCRHGLFSFSINTDSLERWRRQSTGADVDGDEHGGEVLGHRQG
jgi:hypothetical protein